MLRDHAQATLITYQSATRDAHAKRIVVVAKDVRTKMLGELPKNSL